MKRKIIALSLSLLLCVVLTVTAYASDHTLVLDYAGLFTDSEAEALENTAQSLADTYDADVVILTLDNLNGKTAQEYADDYYDQNNYAEDGLLFLISMEEREWYISTSGSAIYAFTDHGLMRLEKAIIPLLSDGDYYDAFSLFLSCIPTFWDAYLYGTPIDGYSDDYGSSYHEEVVYYRQERSTWDILTISILIGLAAAIVSILIMRRSMNTKRKQYSAGAYLTQGSYRLHMHRDIYLYSNVSKVRRQQNSGTSGGSGVHRSSGGRSHGGRGGRF